MCPLCVRFFDSSVREVGSRVIFVSSNGTLQDVVNESAKHLDPTWGISGPLRVLEVANGHVKCRYSPDILVRSLDCFVRKNIFYYSLRVEADTDANLPDEQTLLEISHCDRHSQQAFGQPVLLAVSAMETAGSIKKRIKEKLQVPDAEFKSWRLVRCVRSIKNFLKDDEVWDTDSPESCKLMMEHVHPNPTSSLARQPRYSKPLTIKSG
mmetsp:Transcript_81905/g.160659  ORF Transcript_81905/g.160659 Transcript_81905/m.160659 type:complete len:209 (-) Transcript_81905:43-669(-)